MNKYEALLRYLSKEDGSITFSKHNNKRLVTIKTHGKIQAVTSKVSEILAIFKKDLKEFINKD